MYKLLFLFLIFFSACANQENAPPSTEGIQGIWELEELKVVSGRDTSAMDVSTINQHKIYHGDYYMWNRKGSKESEEWHGYGSFRIEGDTLIETPHVSSVMMKNLMDSVRMTEFRTYLSIQGETFRQILYNPISGVYNIQTYRRIGD